MKRAAKSTTNKTAKWTKQKQPVFLSKLLAIFIAFILALGTLPGCGFISDQYDSSVSVEVETEQGKTGLPDTEVRSLEDIGYALFDYLAFADFTVYHQLVADPENHYFGRGFIVPKPQFRDFSYEASQEEADFYSELLLEVNQYDPARLDPDDLRLYNYVVDYLEASLALAPHFYLMDPYEPSVGIQIELPLSLMTYSFRTREDIEDYITLVSDVPRALDQANTVVNERTKDGIFPNLAAIESAIEEAETYATPVSTNVLVISFEHLLNSGKQPFSGLTAEERAYFAQANREAVETLVIPAYENAIALLEEIAPQTSYEVTLPSLPHADEYYEAYMRLEGFYETPEQAIANLDKNLDSLFSQMFKGYDLLDPDSWEGIVEKNLPKEANEIIEYYNTKIDQHFPDIGKRPFVVDSASDDEVIKMFAAFYLLAPVDDLTENRIVYYPQNISDKFSLGTVLGHESFPGHLYQYNYFGLTDPHPIEQILSTTAYAEGYAVYSEYYTLLYMGFSEEQAQTIHAYMMFLYVLEARLELGINYEGWGLLETSDFLAKWGIGEMAEELYNEVAASPFIMLSYGLGPIEFTDLLTRAQSSLGDDFDIKEFHAAILQDGALPMKVLHKNMYRWIFDEKSRLI